MHENCQEDKVEDTFKLILQLFENQSSLSFRYHHYPINRLYDKFIISQELDFKYPDNPSWKAELKKT